ncbi:TetR/AcrR family transcriptional regulator [Actinocatenispora comari]|jgi:AcrR family transcriptional regulator|uniref:TetR family transcriptional regulator n=1 Tax=Actinocatenispora comari TaxID=2807577 RepID=A0A8J4ALK8_9ACTN|nr:TetR/AcrR family transcriptional regulator [Actinocatenispora comari]GIL31685.1 TetR family transcriptional regulator [Actinocatenispora comari]
MAYHHGQLREAILAAAVETIEAGGLATLSLRDLARRAGVSHAAPAHHFGDRAGLLTALATDGFRLLSEALTAAGENFLERGVAYVRFGTRHRGHFEVMFRPDLYHPDDPELVAAQSRASDLLYSGAATVDADAATTGLAGWALVHGLTSLYNAGVLSERPDDVDALARRVASRLVR